MIAQHCHAHDWDDAGKPAIAWDDKAARDALVSALVNDANLLVDALREAELDQQGSRALALRVGGRAGRRAGRRQRWHRRQVAHRPPGRREPGDQRDRPAGAARAQDRASPPGRVQAHVTVEPDTGLFTAGEVTEAAGEDNHEAVVGLALLDDEEPGELEVLGDSAYGTGDARAALTKKGHTAIIKPVPLRPAVTGGFTLDDFTTDEAAGTVTCPNGLTRPITPSRTVTFGAACRGCPLRARCTTSKTGRSLTLHPHDALLRAARRDWSTNPDLQATYRQHRPMVERSIAWLIGPEGRCRKLRYRGVAANDLWLHTRLAALNLRRLTNLGLHHQHGTWALAPIA